jgi:hypothetical protein
METVDYCYAGLDMNPAIPGAHVWNDNDMNELASNKPINQLNGYKGCYPESLFTQIASWI